MEIAGIHHVKLPVGDVARSRACSPQRHDPARAKALSGFDALALLVPSRADVETWKSTLDEAGEPHGGLVTGHGGGKVLVGLHDPDGTEIRLYAN
jgi:hypothetical protein